MRIAIVTLFPEFFNSPFSTSLLGKAMEKKIIEVEFYPLRRYAINRHGKVDDAPYGGGEGMVLRPEPIHRALLDIKAKYETYVILLSPRGYLFHQRHAERLAKKAHLTLICGHYEGVDERVAEHLVDESLCIGDYVLSGGESAALVVIDALARLQPGYLGNPQSLREESFSREGYLEYPQYTRPAEYQGWKVPEVLLSGNHAQIARFRQEEAIKAWKKYRLEAKEKSFE
ncbi:MAG: tRNA (guanosine(37)-N1)-methyltransferase TrmD [Leptospiraceae bacterium]|nr:tRNA (guanosine(37)-N1)-methyltransferase TrmD [Leptospiraceae bacterium]MDW8306574.1 tRNA (guanosine(37)-N1)-methyltransferase TrmD [Leptospiraceae bacterium]